MVNAQNECGQVTYYLVKLANVHFSYLLNKTALILTKTWKKSVKLFSSSESIKPEQNYNISRVFCIIGKELTKSKIFDKIRVLCNCQIE